MEPRDHKQNRGHSLDQVLDSALARYSRVEPRAGLESRINANLQSESERRTQKVRGRRWWAVLALVATAIAIAMTVWVGSTRKPASGTPTAVAINSRPAVPDLKGPSEVVRLRSNADHGRHLARVGPLSRKLQATIQPPGAAPRREQFPTPTPLSEQEEILARYVTQFRRHAVMLARAQTELFTQERLEETQPSSKPGEPRLNQFMQTSFEQQDK